jgi:predicted AlkP superfamily pyrophosphatase or phosphodiesterase
MPRYAAATITFLVASIVLPKVIRPQQTSHPKPNRNVILFVADGLRHGSVNAQDTPTLWNLREQGVHLQNSHSLFPTFTTANASVHRKQPSS